MIVLDLECAQGHCFEGWFASSTAFQEQCAQGLVSCPRCGERHVSRRPSAPYLHTQPAAAPGPARAAAGTPSLNTDAEHLLAHMRHTAKGLEDVGERFPDEVRRIHHGEAPPRGVKGKASNEALLELLQEGIGVLPIPPDEDFH